MSSEHFYPQSNIRLTTSRIVIISTFTLLCLISFLWFKERQQRFPMMVPGLYSGFIDGIVPQKRIPLLMKRDGAQNLTIIPVLENLQPVQVLLVDRSSSIGISEGQLPVSYSFDAVQLKFIGDQVGDRYVGSVFDLSTGKVGTWYLVRSDLKIQDSNVTRLTRQWLSARVERENISADNSILEEQIVQKQDEIKKLESYITEGAELKTNADKKYKIEALSLEEIEAKFKKRTLEIEKLRSQVTLAQQLSSVGRLAQLSRETMQKEKIWFLGKLSE